MDRAQFSLVGEHDAETLAVFGDMGIGRDMAVARNDGAAASRHPQFGPTLHGILAHHEDADDIGQHRIACGLHARLRRGGDFGGQPGIGLDQGPADSSGRDSTLARPTRASSAGKRIRVTPCVLRPTWATSATRVRTSVPWLLISMIS